MSQYKETLFEIGCDTLEIIAVASVEDLVVDGRMKKMHAKIFLKAVKDLLKKTSSQENGGEKGDGNLDIVNTNDDVVMKTTTTSNTSSNENCGEKGDGNTNNVHNTSDNDARETSNMPLKDNYCEKGDGNLNIVNTNDND